MISEGALDGILASEGLDQPWPWPRGDSGIALGYGDDLGYDPVADFARDGEAHLTPAALERLSAACLRRGACPRPQAEKCHTWHPCPVGRRAPARSAARAGTHVLNLTLSASRPS